MENQKDNNMYDLIERSLYEISLDKSKTNKLIEELSKNGFGRGYSQGIIQGNINVKSLDQIVIALLLIKLYNVSSKRELNPERFFEDAEIKVAKKHTYSSNSDLLEYPIVIPNVTPLKYGMWSTVVSADFILKLNRSNAMNYNFNTQRQATNLVVNGGIIPIASVNWESVESIKQEMLQDTFFPNMVTLNIPTDDEDVDFNFDATRNTLTLNSGQFDIIDGYHRILGIINSSMITDMDCNFILRITNFDVSTANQLIIQEDKRNPIEETHIKAIDDTDYNTVCVNELGQSAKSPLRGKITKERKLINQGYALVTFDTMYSIIKELWSLNTMLETRKTTDYLISYFDKVCMVFEGKCEPEQGASSGFSGLSDERMFALYLYIAKITQKEEDEEILDGLLEDVRENIDLIKSILSEIYPSTIKNNPKKVIEEDLRQIIEVIKSV